jgi:hypothetical protein
VDERDRSGDLRLLERAHASFVAGLQVEQREP